MRQRLLLSSLNYDRPQDQDILNFIIKADIDLKRQFSLLTVTT